MDNDNIIYSYYQININGNLITIVFKVFFIGVLCVFIENIRCRDDLADIIRQLALAGSCFGFIAYITVSQERGSVSCPIASYD